jgi:hypothetical protein
MQIVTDLNTVVTVQRRQQHMVESHATVYKKIVEVQEVCYKRSMQFFCFLYFRYN